MRFSPPAFGRVALRQKPELLEKIGVIVRNSKTSAQRAGVLKAQATRLAKRKTAA